MGAAASAAPTGTEAAVVAAAAARRQEHLDANAARALTKEERREKAARRAARRAARDGGVPAVAVVRLPVLGQRGCPLGVRLKVEANAKQLGVGGVLAVTGPVGVLVVEGGAAEVAKMEALLLRRIRWAEVLAGPSPAEGGLGGGGPAEAPPPPPPLPAAAAAAGAPAAPRAVRVWGGRVAVPAWPGPFSYKAYRTEERARSDFRRRGVEMYWDTAYGFPMADATLGKREM